MAQQNDTRIDSYNPVTNEGKRNGVPLTMAQAPHQYVPGEQEGPVQLASVADMLHRMSDAIAILGSIDIILGCVDR